MYTAAAWLQGSKVHYKAKNKNGAETAPFHIKRNIKELTIRRMSKFKICGENRRAAVQPQRSRRAPYSRGGGSLRQTINVTGETAAAEIQ